MLIKRIGRAAVVLIIAVGTLAAQVSKTQPVQQQDVATELRQLTTLLQETRAELQQYRAEVEQLKAEVKRLQPAPAASAPAPVSAEAANAQLQKRVADLENRQQLTSNEVKDQYQTKVESGSRYRVRLSGLLLMNMHENFGVVNDSDVPSVALAHGPTSPSGDFGGTVRQSEFTLQANGPDVWGARMTARLTFDFFGGMPTATIDGVTMGIGRVKVADIRFDGESNSVVAGLDQPFISPLEPTSYASVGFPPLGASGNLWTWTPEVYAEHRSNAFDTWTNTLQAGVLDPLDGEPAGSSFSRKPEAGEKSRMPAFAARDAISRTRFDRPLSFGLGGYFGRQAYPPARTVNAWAVTGDWQVPLTTWLDLSGEAYRGRAIGGLWASEGNSIVRSGPVTDPASKIAGLNVVGGWSQLKFLLTPKLEANAVFGMDNPFASDLLRFSTAEQGRLFARNQTFMVNVIEHPRSDLILSLEFRHLNTSFVSAPSQTADQINTAIGVLF